MDSTKVLFCAPKPVYPYTSGLQDTCDTMSGPLCAVDKRYSVLVEALGNRLELL